MRLDRKPRQHLVAVAFGLDQGGVSIEFLAPDQPIILTALDLITQETSCPFWAVLVRRMNKDQRLSALLTEVPGKEDRAR